MRQADGHNRMGLPVARPLALRGVAVLWAMACLLAAPIAWGQSTSPTLDVEVGFGGEFTPDRTTPIAVQIDHEGLPIDGELVVRQTWRPLLDPPRTIEARRSVTLGPKARVRYSFFLPLSSEAPPNGEAPQLIVELRASGQLLAQRIVALENARRGGLVVMASESGYLQELPTGEMTVQLEASDMPEDWRAYGGVRRLYIGRLDVTRLDPDQQTAIRKWVTSGGELGVLGGDNAYRQDVDWLNGLIPFQIDSIDTIDGINARVALGEARGDVLYGQNDRPLLVHWRFGRGEVWYSALALVNAGPTQNEIWKQLESGRTELSGPSTLGADLFRRMPLYYPDKTVLAGLFAVYMAGIGLLMLWTLRRTPWKSGGRSEVQSATTGDDESTNSAGRDRLWLGMVAWIGLAAALAIGYSGQPAYTGQMQSLEAGILWGSARAELMHVTTGHSAIAKRELRPQWTLPTGTSVVPLKRTDLSLADNAATVRPLSGTLMPNGIHDVALEVVRPLPIRVEADGDSAVSADRFRVYNESHFRLRESIMWHRGRYYAAIEAPIAPGQSRAIDLSEADPVAEPWFSGTGRPSGFLPQTKETLFDAVYQELREREEPWALLAWVREPGFSTHSGEYRETWRLLVVTPS